MTDGTDKENLYPTLTQMQIKWPEGLGDFFNTDVPASDANGSCRSSASVDEQKHSSDSVVRPDSGVGESVSVRHVIINANDTTSSIIV